MPERLSSQQDSLFLLRREALFQAGFLLSPKVGGLSSRQDSSFP